ncbi:MAG: DUF262 domain-containing protein [Enhydrobacter sp.]|nr:DUF262 domain-containing protein [Enhydrobacter sp.]
MAAQRNLVNLDALLPREDLAAPADTMTGDIKQIKLADLEPCLVYNMLRKPDFQRETASWTPEQVVDLIETFLSGDIIPAIILWQSGNRVFVIDGAHRLSALIAWVRDDYGAGKLSAQACSNSIPPLQRAMHDATKVLLAGKRLPSYEEHKLAGDYPSTTDAATLARAVKFSFRGIELQWIENASVQQATAAFFRINQGGTRIDPTEMRILRAKNSALAISTRAIARGGEGHNYWDRFPAAEVKRDIKALGAELHRLLFVPPLVLPVKTTDVPVGGFGYGGHVLPFAFDLVGISNDLNVPDSSRKKAEDKELADDPNGMETLRYLRAAKRMIELLCSNEPFSLGLHPALYFYTTRGAFHAAAVFNMVTWIKALESRGKINRFLNSRGKFEDLILAHPVVAKPAAHKLGSGGRTRLRMVTLYGRLLDLLSAGATAEEAWSSIVVDPDYVFLAADDAEEKNEASEGKAGGRFGRSAKSAGFIEQFLRSVPRCSLCGGLLHVNGMVSHHAEERSAGGSSASYNVEMVHPVCNSNNRQRNAGNDFIA